MKDVPGGVSLLTIVRCPCWLECLQIVRSAETSFQRTKEVISDMSVYCLENVSEMRAALMHRTKYRSYNWERKVRQMSDSQVIAVYLRFCEQRMFK